MSTESKLQLLLDYVAAIEKRREAEDLVRQLACAEQAIAMAIWESRNYDRDVLIQVATDVAVKVADPDQDPARYEWPKSPVILYHFRQPTEAVLRG
jgi:hypothetical protein